MYTQTHIDVNTNVLLPAKLRRAYPCVMGLPERLQAKMEAANLTQYALAGLSGVPQPTIQRILSGASREPRRSTLVKLAHHLQTTAEELLLGDRDTAPAKTIQKAASPPIIEDHEWNALSLKQREFIERLSLTPLNDTAIDALQGMMAFVTKAPAETPKQTPVTADMSTSVLLNTRKQIKDRRHRKTIHTQKIKQEKS